MSHNLTQCCLVELLIEICLFNPFAIVSQRAGMIDRSCALQLPRQCELLGAGYSSQYRPPAG